MSMKRPSSNAKTAAMFGGVAVFMVGLSFAAIPLYEAFCRITGFGGTPLQADAGSSRVLDETITVRFDANTDPKLPWTFKPVQTEMTLPIGETGLAFYTATNNSDRPVAGTSTFNVTPLKIQTAEVEGITLSYTFYETEISDPKLAELPGSGPKLN